jgi:uncharacterized protein (DUF736 family)
MNIGQFTKAENGDFSGKASVLFGQSVVTLEKVKAEGNKPGFIIHVDGSEVGAAWEKTSAGGNAYTSVSFDLPTQPAPIYGALFANKDGSTYSLVWDRPKPQAA